MFCTACGMKNAADSNFCKQCGHRLEKPVAPRSEEPASDSVSDRSASATVLERAYRLWKQGDTAAAIALCEEALALRQDSAAAHSLLAQCYESNGNREQAIREYEHALRLNPSAISDRVKLDELQSGPRATHLAPPPSTVLSDRRNGESISRLMVASVAACGLLLIGSALVIHSKQSSAPSQQQPSANTASGSRYAPASDAMGAGSAPNWTRPDAPGYGPAAPPAPDARMAYHAATNDAHSAAPGTLSNTVARNVAAPMMPRSPQTPLPARDLSRRVRPITPGSAQGHDDGARVLITNTSDENTPEGPIVIPVSRPAGTEPKPPRTASTDSGPRISITISPHQTPANGTEPDAAPDSGAATLAIANDLKRREEFDKAIAAYRKALPTAGDDSALVYQQLGQCYQSRGDKNNAIANFQKAIDAYQNLVKAGHQADFAMTGIRVCKSGIKICAGE